MTSEKFCLRWNDFESNISQAFQEIRNDNDLFDVTLACDDEQIQCHKLILSACSLFFRNILRRNPHQHPLLYLKGVNCVDIESILNFMYHGEVSIAQEQLNSFLAVAEDLQVKGLTQNNKDCDKKNVLHHTKSSAQQNLSSRPMRRISDAPPPTISSHNSSSKQCTDNPNHLVVPVKPEPKETVPEAQHDDYYYDERQPVACVEDDGHGYQNDQSVGYEHQDYDQGYGVEDNSSIEEYNSDINDRKSLLKYITQLSVESGSSFQCTLCGKTNGQKNNVMKHVESIHFPGSFTHYCKLCNKTVKTKSALEWHNTQYHGKKHQKYM